MYKQIVRRLPKMSNIMYICEEGCENPLLNLNKKTCVCYSQKRFYEVLCACICRGPFRFRFCCENRKIRKKLTDMGNEG